MIIIKNFFKYIFINYEFFILIVLSLTIRIHGIFEYSLGNDDVTILDFSNYSTIKDFFIKAYYEVHPPLNYIAIFLLNKIYPSIILLRIYQSVISLFFIILTYYFLKKHECKLYFFISLIFATSLQLIELSQSLRSYNLMYLFYILYLDQFILLNNKDEGKMLKLFLYGSFCLLSDYSSVISIIFFDLFLFFKLKSHFVKFNLIFHIFLIYFQKYLISKISRINVFSHGYHHHHNNILDYIYSYYHIFAKNIFDYNILAIIFIIILIFAIFNKQKFIIYYLLFSMFLLYVCDYFTVLPIVKGRQTLIYPITLVLLISLIRNNIIYLKILSVSKICFFLYFSLQTKDSEPFFISSGKYRGYGYRKEENLQIVKKIENYIKKNNGIKLISCFRKNPHFSEDFFRLYLETRSYKSSVFFDRSILIKSLKKYNKILFFCDKKEKAVNYKITYLDYFKDRYISIIEN